MAKVIKFTLKHKNINMYFAEIMLASREEAYLFSLTDLGWRNGPQMPKNLCCFTSVQIENGFMAVGGKDEERLATSNVLTFDNNYNWVSYDDALQIEKVYSIGVNVPNSFFDC